MPALTAKATIEAAACCQHCCAALPSSQSSGQPLTADHVMCVQCSSAVLHGAANAQVCAGCCQQQSDPCANFHTNSCIADIPSPVLCCYVLTPAACSTWSI